MGFLRKNLQIRLLRPGYLLVAGTAGAVVGLGVFHAVIHDEVYLRSFRVWWALAYILLLYGAAYAIGLLVCSK